VPCLAKVRVELDEILQDRVDKTPFEVLGGVRVHWVFGRRDFTISVMGANIYPEDLEQCVYADPELARITRE
jgi:phenylacetate-coenzyme A ligase PaaK-like adenylate-forming protein